MKKVYEKPMMAVERYVLTQKIAACETKIGFADSNCLKNDGDTPQQLKDFIWAGGFTSTENCNKYANDNDVYNGICYHTSASATFTS